MPGRAGATSHSLNLTDIMAEASPLCGALKAVPAAATDRLQEPKPPLDAYLQAGYIRCHVTNGSFMTVYAGQAAPAEPQAL